ncbi:hypothetical protein [Methylibium petroleiphilum]
MKRQVADRIFLALLTLLIVCVCAFETSSLGHFMVTVGGLPAVALLVVLALLSLSALGDTLLNDVLPERYVFRTGLRCRQGLWLTIAVLHTMQAWVLMNNRVGYWVAASYFLIAVRCAAVSFLDLRYRHSCERTTDFGALDA